MPKIARCPTCHRRYRRNNEQNARYWLLLHMMSEKIKVRGETFSAEAWHEYSKGRFLGKEEVHLPSGKIKVIEESTADLDVDKFGDYMTKVEAFANEHGAFLEDDEHD